VPGQAVALSYGGCHQGSIDAFACRATYTFEASSGDVVSLRVSDSNGSMGVYPEIRVYDPSGALVASEWAGAGVVSAEIDGLPLPTAGTYTILAGDHGGSETGSYGLHLQCVSSPGQAVTLSYGDCVDGSVDGRACRTTYSFVASAGDIVSIRMWDSNGYMGVYPEIRVYDSSGALVASDWAEVGVVSAEISDLILWDSGPYTILAGDYDGSHLGPFEFCLDGYETVGLPEDSVPLNDNVMVLGALPNPSSGEVSFQLALPTKAEVEFMIYSPGGRLLARTSRLLDPGNQTIELISHTLPSGVYYYTVRVGDATHRGRFALVQ
jgi:hypothetical protein